MSTPNLRTYVRNQVQRRDAGMQTAFPAKVSAYASSTNTVTVIPQFLEDGEERAETITNVPVCFPHFLSWEIDPGTFGLVICTKYSLDRWREELQPGSPKDMRRFTMSGATFHPVVMGETPSLAQDFVAMADLINKFFKAFINTMPSPVPDSGAAIQTAVKKAVTSGAAWNDLIHTVASSKVKAEV